MIMRGIDFPYIHDLASLMTIHEAHREHNPDTIRRAAKLTGYAVHTWYPSLDVPVSEQAYAEAIQTAEAVVQWAGSSAYDTESLLAAAQATVRVRFETRRFLNFVAGFAYIIHTPCGFDRRARGLFGSPCFLGGHRCARSSM